VLEERAGNLEAENKELLERWMKRMSAEAEKMNDANDFLESIRGMRMSSPAADETTTVDEKKEEI
jgi:hypothetical protein